MAVGGVQKNIGCLGLQQSAQAGLAGFDAAVDTRVAQVHGLAVHRPQHFVGHWRWPG